MLRLILASCLFLTLLTSASASEGAEQTRIIIQGQLPLWKILLASDDPVSSDEISKLCPGGANGLELSKCLQQELETTEAGKGFVASYGGIQGVEVDVDTKVSGSKRGKKALIVSALAAPTVAGVLIGASVKGDDRAVSIGFGTFIGGLVSGLAAGYTFSEPSSWPKDTSTRQHVYTFKSFNTLTAHFERRESKDGIVYLEGRDLDGKGVFLLIDGGVNR